MKNQLDFIRQEFLAYEKLRENMENIVGIARTKGAIMILRDDDLMAKTYRDYLKQAEQHKRNILKALGA